VAVLSAAAGDSDDTEVRFLQSVEFTEEVEIVESRIDPSEIMDGDNVLAALSALGEAPQKYTVQPGDCLSCIASKFGMKGVEELRLLNPWIVDDTIYPGDEMIIRGFQPKLGVKTVEIEITQEEIQHDTIYEQDPTLRIGKTKVLKPGMNGLKKVTYELTSINGQLINEELIAEEVLVEPVSAIVAKGTLRLAGEGTGKFAWPVSGAKLTSSFGKRWGRMHEGIDLASSNRTIKAADSGKVTFAGTKNGYGKTVIIDHSNGYQTLYAHLSKITVSKGDIVEKGDQVGVMGSTGNSTGVHLHFEIHKDGEPKNPISYLNK
jgi:murein DD-endopeptidase MepM/ murein hydrolase activator NlpD